MDLIVPKLTPIEGLDPALLKKVLREIEEKLAPELARMARERRAAEIKARFLPLP